MTSIDVDGIIFNFAVGWGASKYDDWSFYRNKFVKIANGTKAVDVLAVGPGHVVWFLEVKDYRRHARTKVIDLAEEVAQKVRDTLAAMLPGSLSDVAGEQAFCVQVLASTTIRVALHVAQPAKHSKLFPRAIDPADVTIKLRSKLKPIDPHPKVFESSAGAPWTVS